MGLILCDKNIANDPYYISEMGISVYTAEELCYCIYENPMLFMDKKPDERLITFVRDELHMAHLADSLSKVNLDSDNKDEWLINILQQANYYNSLEIARFKSRISELRELDEKAYKKKKADFYFLRRRYVDAINSYMSILLKYDITSDWQFGADIYHSIGNAYANLMMYDEAFDNYVKAYKMHKSKEILKHIYFISLETESIEQKKKFREFVPQIEEAWDRSYQKIYDIACESEEIKNIDRLLDNDISDDDKKIGISIIIDRWKKQCRNMIQG